MLELLFTAIEKWPLFGWFLLGCGVFALIWGLIIALKTYIEHLWLHPDEIVVPLFIIGMLVFAGMFVFTLRAMGKI